MTDTGSVDIELLANLPKGKKPPLLSPFVKPASEPKPPKSAILIYNPVGGKQKAARIAERLVLPMLKEAGVQVETRTTEYQGHAGEMGRTLPLAGVDALLVMGGDGTLSELLDGFQLVEMDRAARPPFRARVARSPRASERPQNVTFTCVSGFMQREDGAVSSCTLGFIPAGTGNTYVGEALGIKTAGASDTAVRAAVQACPSSWIIICASVPNCTRRPFLKREMQHAHAYVHGRVHVGVFMGQPCRRSSKVAAAAWTASSST